MRNLRGYSSFRTEEPRPAIINRNFSIAKSIGFNQIELISWRVNR